LRRQFRDLPSGFARKTYVGIEEMGAHLGLPRLSGRAAPGTRVRERVPADWGGHISTIGALAQDGIRTALSIPGAIEGETLLSFVEELRLPTLHRGEIVILDNCPIPKLDELEEVLDAAGVSLLFLPP
jgi:hypothetical protein